jgi:hypothetical protein
MDQRQKKKEEMIDRMKQYKLLASFMLMQSRAKSRGR